MMGWRWAIVAALVCAAPVTAQDITLDTGEAGDGLRSTLRDASLLLSLTPEDAPVAQDYVAAARADYRRLLTALYADGYYGGDISITVNGQQAANIAPLDAPATVDRIVISVTPGPRFTFGDLSLGPVPQGAAVSEGFVTGAPARSDVISRSVRQAVTAWRDLGYAKASTGAQSVVAQHRSTTLDVDVTIVPGPRLRFGGLDVTGNEDVSSARIRAIAGLPDGRYSAADIAAAERRLRDTGAFSSVQLIEDDEIGPNETLRITAQVAEAKPRRFGFGVEVSSIEGLRLSSFWMHRNAFGGAERLRVDAEVSGINGETGGIDYSLGTSLKVPSVTDRDTDLLLTATLSRDEEPDFDLDQVEVEAIFTRHARRNLDLSAGLGLIRARETTDAGTRTYTLLTAPLGGELDYRDDAANTTEGFYVDLDVTPFASLEGAENGARIFADTRAYRTIADDRVILAARGQFGSVVSASAETAPADFLFFSGGGGTVRGQPYNDLGVETLDAGEVIRRGGLSFAGAQLETRVNVTDDIGVVGFYDLGFVGETADPFDEGDWHGGAGLGIRYNTGIGPIRFDIGTPTTGDKVGEQVEFYIGIGQAF